MSNFPARAEGARDFLFCRPLCVDRDLAEVFVFADSYQSVKRQADRSYSLHTVEDRVHCDYMLAFSDTVSTRNDS